MNDRVPGGPLLDAPDLESLPGVLASRAGSIPDHVLFREPDASGVYSSVTYGEFRTRVDRLARAMLDLREKPVVGVTGNNGSPWCAVYMAAIRSGGVVVPIDRELPVQEMLTILHYSGANMVFFDARFADDFVERFAGRERPAPPRSRRAWTSGRPPRSATPPAPPGRPRASSSPRGTCSRTSSR